MDMLEKVMSRWKRGVQVEQGSRRVREGVPQEHRQRERDRQETHGTGKHKGKYLGMAMTVTMLYEKTYFTFFT